MEKQELIQYLTQAYELESKVFEQRELIQKLELRKMVGEGSTPDFRNASHEDYQTYSQLNKAIENEARKNLPNNRAEKQKLEMELTSLSYKTIPDPQIGDPKMRTPVVVAAYAWMIIGIIAFFGMAAMNRSFLISGDIVIKVIIFCLLVIVLPIVVLIIENVSAVKRHARRLEQVTAEVKEARAQRQIQISNLQGQIRRLDNQKEGAYQKRLRLLHSQLLDLVNPALAETRPVLVTLENTLDQLYSLNVLYPKYRSFVCVATILEYLQSGRCEELTGPNGAYNLYEAEMRADTIITKLDNIEHKLDQVIANQHTLYYAINQTNRRLGQITQQLDQSIALQKATLVTTAITAANTAITAACTAAIAANTEALKYIALVG